MAKDAKTTSGSSDKRAPATLRADEGANAANTPSARPAAGAWGERAEDARRAQELAGAGSAGRGAAADTDQNLRGSGVHDVVDAAQGQMPGAPDLAVRVDDALDQARRRDFDKAVAARDRKKD